MFSRKGAGVLAGAVCCLALAAPVVAFEPLDPKYLKGGPGVAVCVELRKDMLFYHSLVMKGGTPKQMEVWKARYRKYVWGYGRNNCRQLARKMAIAGFKEMQERIEEPAPTPSSAEAIASTN